MKILKLKYREKEYYGKTWAVFVDHFPELGEWTNVVYNNRRNYSNDIFKINTISLLDRIKDIQRDDKRKRKIKKIN